MVEGSGGRFSFARLAAAVDTLWQTLTFPRVFYYLAAAALATSTLGVLLGNGVILPALDVLAVLPAWAWIRRGRRLQAAASALLFWALCKVVIVAAWTVVWPARAAAAVAFGPDYAAGMLLWLRSGADLADVGAISSLRLVGTLLVGGLGAVTAGVGGLAAGAVLLNCQAYYLGVLLARTTEPWRVLVFGWPGTGSSSGRWGS